MPKEYLCKNENEKLLFDFLNENPRQYIEIVKFIQWKGVRKPGKKSISRQTINRILKENEKNKRICRVEREEKIYYMLSISETR